MYKAALMYTTMGPAKLFIRSNALKPVISVTHPAAHYYR